MKRKAFDLPAKWYALRQLTADQIAACVMVCPERCPSRESLPREIVQCEGLKTVLALAVAALRAEQMARQIKKKLGKEYLCRLLKLSMLDTRTDYAYIGDLDWYVQQYLEQCELEGRFWQAASMLSGAHQGAMAMVKSSSAGELKKAI